jgi:SAM-dependent methyltransferase
MDKEKEFYTKFTYPFAGVKRNKSVNGEVEFKILDYEIGKDYSFNNMSVLDVGCGTGQRIIDIARCFSKARIDAFDFSESSIRIAFAQASREKISNINFYQDNINNMSTCKMYDVVIANGVLHHLEDPIRSISNMIEHLNNNGMLYCWLYHYYGEFERLIKRKLISTLVGSSNDNFDVRLKLMRELKLTISSSRYGKSYGEFLTEKDELSKNADAFINPIVNSYTFNSIIEIIKEIGLEWIAIDQINYEGYGHLVSLDNSKAFWNLNMREKLGSEYAYNFYCKLDNINKLHVIEELIMPTGFSFVAGTSKSFALRSRRLRNSVIMLNV